MSKQKNTATEEVPGIDFKLLDGEDKTFVVRHIIKVKNIQSKSVKTQSTKACQL